MEAGGTLGPLQNTILDKNVFGSESFGPAPPCGDQKGTQNEVQNRLKSNKKFNVSYTVLEDASGTLFETKKASQNMSRSKQKTSLKDITFCITFFHKFLSKTKLKPIRAQWQITFFAVIYSSFEHFALWQRLLKSVSASFQSILVLVSKTYRKAFKIRHRKHVESCLSTHTVFSSILTSKTTPESLKFGSKVSQKRSQQRGRKKIYI